MNTRRDPDRLIHTFLMEGATELADEVYVTVRDHIDHTRQRAVFGSWREPDVNRYLKIAMAVAAVVVVAVVGFRQFGGSNVSGPGSTATPGPTATPAVTPEPSASGAPPSSETYTSERYGITFSYPTGWVARPATEPWTTGAPDCGSASGDLVIDLARECNLWVSVASQPISDSTPEEWAAKTLTLYDGCPTTEPITVDGAAGLIGTVGCDQVAVTTGGRGYFIWLYTSGDEAWIGETFDRAWFEEFLATVQLQPEDAVDVAPPASGAPPSSETYTSERYGVTFSYPKGWTARPATEPWTTSVPDYAQNTGDVVYDAVRQGNLWVVVASQPLGDSTPDVWVNQKLTVDALGLEGSCTATEPITVDGATGLIGAEGCNAAAVTTDGRGYFILLYTSSDEPALADTYDRAWFQEFLSTVQLQPVT